MAYLTGCIFFFQAEDGIRDLVRSRGLGDVYKRQVPAFTHDALQQIQQQRVRRVLDHRERTVEEVGQMRTIDPVSYTHLTLPTSDLV